jgi:phage RecT family recombinase
MTAVAKAEGRSLAELVVTEWADKINGTAHHGFDANRMAAGLMQAAAKEPNILKASPASLFIALSNCARWGLDIGEGAYLVAIGGRVEAWPDYRGLKALAIRQGIIRGSEEQVVYEADHFHLEYGSEARLIHRPCLDEKTRGKMLGAYTVITLRFQAKTWHWMPLGDIDRIRAKSRSWSPKQVGDCPPWYAKKTVIRDWLNRQPKSGALADALAHDDVLDGEATPMDHTTGEILRPDATHRALSAGLDAPPAALAVTDDDLELDRKLFGEEG